MELEKIVTHLRFSRVICNRSLRDLILECYPILNYQSDYMRFMQYLLFQRDYSAKSGRIVICGRTIAHCMGSINKYYQGNLKKGESTGSFLFRFKKDVLPDFTWTKPNPKQGLCREVKNQGIESTIIEARDILQSTPPSEIIEPVFFDNGKSVTEKSKSELRKKYFHWATELEEDAKCKIERNLLRYMNSIPSKTFSRIKDRISDAIDYVNKTLEGKSRDSALLHIKAIGDHQKPFYHPTKNSYRIFCEQHSLQGIRSDIRRILAKDWLEFDLRAAQFANIATVWDLKELYKFLQSGENIWTYLCDDIGVGGGGKTAIKQAIYATVYGMKESNIPGQLKNSYQQATGNVLGDEVVNRFLENKIFLAVLQARNEKLEDIRHKGGAYDVFDKWISIDQRNERTVLSMTSQAWELLLLEPAIDLAISELKKKQPEFRIVLWQHDGFSIWVRQKSREKAWAKKLIEAVNSRAKEYNVPTILEIVSKASN